MRMEIEKEVEAAITASMFDGKVKEMEINETEFRKMNNTENYNGNTNKLFGINDGMEIDEEMENEINFENVYNLMDDAQREIIDLTEKNNKIGLDGNEINFDIINNLKDNGQKEIIDLTEEKDENN